jgi:hypothetical protein
MNLNVIEHLTAEYSASRDELARLVTDLNDRLDAINAKYIGEIRAQAAVTLIRRNSLQSAIEDNPALFESPRTRIFHGIKVGLRKGTGKIDWDDDEKVCARIAKQFDAAKAELLIKTTHKPIYATLKDLSAAELRSLGCTVESTGDTPVIKPVAGDLDKLVAVILESEPEKAEAA